MVSETEWEPPGFVESLQNPELRRKWAERVAAWTEANPEIAECWDLALAWEQQSRWDSERRRGELVNLRAAGLPGRCIEVWRTGIRATHAVETVRTFLASGKTFLLLLGSAGTGKTLATTEALIRRGSLFRRSTELARLSMFNRDDQREFDLACRASVLVVDDLGAEMLHDGWRPMLDELMDRRYGESRPTIVTSNLDKPAFKTRYGERISDRIRHSGFVESCGDVSLRRQA